jgi:mono/diheme cytochrome c family protein
MIAQSLRETFMRRISKLVLVGIASAAMAGVAADKKAERNWKSKCASCHGADGKGQTDQGKKMQVEDMSSAKWQSAKTDAQIKDAIENGAKKGDAVMDGFKDKLSPEDTTALVSYIRTLTASSKAAKKKAKAAKAAH